MKGTQRKRILIVGGVAGGASTAARARRLDEDAEIVVFDRGAHVSFANCGLPYFVGDVIEDERDLIVATPERFRRRFDIEVRTRSEVTRANPEDKTIEVHGLDDGRRYTERYDALVLSPGAAPIRPPLPGIDLPGIFSVRTIPDTRRIKAWLAQRQARRAVVIGGGFIGLEMAENLARLGLQVAIVERADAVLPPLDPEVAVPVQWHLADKGVDLRLGDSVARFDEGTDGDGQGAGQGAKEGTGALVVTTVSGARLPADLVILAIGVRPETALAVDAGLDLGPRGGIAVDEHMRTSVPDIWAVGDAVEVCHAITGVEVVLPLAGPANRQGRIAAADVCGRPGRFRGVQGTAVCGVFDLTVATTGANEAGLRRAGVTDVARVYLHPGHHVGYFPGARPIHIKLLFRPSDGHILGAQAVGEEGVARRIDVISMAIQMGGTVADLAEAELCYAPQFGAAKDPVNIAGMIASNVIAGDLHLADWAELSAAQDPGDALLVDVRSPAEVEASPVPGAINLPLEELRVRVDELPADADLVLLCEVGQRAYYASRLLAQRGRNVRVLSGGRETCAWFGAG